MMPRNCSLVTFSSSTVRSIAGMSSFSFTICSPCSAVWWPVAPLSPVSSQLFSVSAFPLSPFPFPLFLFRRTIAQLFVMGGTNAQLAIGQQVSLPGHFALPVWRIGVVNWE